MHGPLKTRKLNNKGRKRSAQIFNAAHGMILLLMLSPPKYLTKIIPTRTIEILKLERNIFIDTTKPSLYWYVSSTHS